LREPSSASRGDGARRCQGRDRGKLHDLEFGGGKLEQIANLVTGIGMLGAAAWIATKAMAIVGGEAAIGTPLGLALAAIVGALNAYINFLPGTACAARLRGKALSSCRVNCTRGGSSSFALSSSSSP
jgi:hypothetical protein